MPMTLKLTLTTATTGRLLLITPICHTPPQIILGLTVTPKNFRDCWSMTFHWPHGLPDSQWK